MSRFHFDEAVMSATASELSNAAQNIASCSVQVQKTITAIVAAKGFSLEGIISDVNSEINKLTVLSFNLINGKSEAERFNDIVKRFTQLAASKYYYLPDEFSNVDTDYLTEKAKYYDENFSTHVANVFDAAKLKFDLTSEKEQQLESGIDSVMESLGMPDDGADVYGEVISPTFKFVSDLKFMFGFDSPAFGFISELSDDIEISSDLIGIIDSKYNTVMDYLDSMLETYKDDPLMIKVIQKKRDEYLNTYKACMENFAEWIANKGINVVKSESFNTFLGSIGWSTPFKATKFSLGISGKALGYDDIYKCNQNIQGIEQVRQNAYTAYTEAFDKLRSGNYNERDIENAHNLFDVYKASLISEYKAMINYENIKKKSELNPILEPQNVLIQRNKERIENHYESIISEYQKKIEEIQKLENPVILADRYYVK